MGKAGIGRIFKNYCDTLRTGVYRNRNWRDYVTHFAIPAIVAIAIFVAPQSVSSSIRSCFGNAITALSIVSALLCGLAVAVFQLRIQISSGSSGVEVRGAEVELIDELFAAILWAVVAGFSAAGLMVVAGIDNLANVVCDIATACSLGVTCNFAVVVCMCLKRLSIAYHLASKEWGRRG